MTAPTLSPAMGFDLADAAYSGRDVERTEVALARSGLGTVQQHWEPQSEAVVRSVSGVSSESGFALVLKGREGSPYRGQRAVMTRGTQTLADWGTNLSAIPWPGPAGVMAHAGFVRTWNAMRDNVIAALGPDRTGIVHVTGHSLGGALATLAALDLKNSGFSGATLYTYASPRVFPLDAGAGATQTIGGDRMFRVYDWGDPVPFLPPYPFRHVPMGLTDFRVGGHGRFQLSRHLAPNYRALLRDKTWSGLGAANADTVDTYAMRQADRYLALARAQGGFSAFGYYLIGKALEAVMASVDIAFTVAAVGMTLLDILLMAAEWLAAKAARLGEAAASKVAEIAMQALRWCGAAAGTVGSATARFLRWVAQKVGDALAAIAELAVGQRFRGS